MIKIDILCYVTLTFFVGYVFNKNTNSDLLFQIPFPGWNSDHHYEDCKSSKINHPKEDCQKRQDQGGISCSRGGS